MSISLFRQSYHRGLFAQVFRSTRSLVRDLGSTYSLCVCIIKTLSYYVCKRLPMLINQWAVWPILCVCITLSYYVCNRLPIAYQSMSCMTSSTNQLTEYIRYNMFWLRNPCVSDFTTWRIPMNHSLIILLGYWMTYEILLTWNHKMMSRRHAREIARLRILFCCYHQHNDLFTDM